MGKKLNKLMPNRMVEIKLIFVLDLKKWLLTQNNLILTLHDWLVYRTTMNWVELKIFQLVGIQLGWKILQT